jgi:hypothetical protein
MAGIFSLVLFTFHKSASNYFYICSIRINFKKVVACKELTAAQKSESKKEGGGRRGLE